MYVQEAHAPESANVLMGTIAHNQHVQNIAAALHEANLLGAYYTGGVDHWRIPVAGTLRNLAGACWPGLNSRLGRRRISTIPEDFVHANWRWETWRLLAGKVAHKPLIEDWFWEKDEKNLDRNCARLMCTADFNVFLGVEHGALFSVEAAKMAGKKSVVAFLSPHYETRKKWVDVEYERFPELLTASKRALLLKGPERDARKDKEAAIADVVHCASRFTRDSLLASGVPAEKVICVPLGCPEVAVPPVSTNQAKNKVRFLYAGSASVQKGAHVLLKAWEEFGGGHHAELHFYGQRMLPTTLVARHRDHVFFHGNVTRSEMYRAYQESSILVFPTLCDGFGMVAAEAFAHGLPVITTRNAGAADLILEGKNGFIVPAGDSEALAQRLEWCTLHPREVFAMREEALNTARRWTWARFRSTFRTNLLDKLGLTTDCSFAHDCRP
jgi:glycosyltransferase involved in cell wall biosynthesis